MPSSYSDEVLLSALEYARGDDRTVLVGALGEAKGDRGPAALRRLAAPESGEGGYVRAVAIVGLARRTGVEGTPTYVRALRDRSVPVQLAAAGALAEYGNERATSETLAWLRRKLRRKARSASLDPTEVPSVLRFADRNGVLRDVADLLAENRDQLDPDEWRWLVDVWPAFATAPGMAGDIAPPDREKLDQPLYEDHRLEPDRAEEARLEDEYVRSALARAQKRARAPGR